MVRVNGGVSDAGQVHRTMVGMPEDVPSVRVSIVIPVLNEMEGLPDLLREVSRARDKGAEVVLVDNGSTDGTWEALCATLGVVVVQEQRVGFGSAVKTGLLHAQGDVVAWMPGNLRVSIDDALELADRVATGTGRVFAKGWRTGRPTLDTVTSGVAGFILSAAGRSDLRDFGGSPTAVPREAVTVLLGGPDDLAFEPYALWKLPRAGYRPVRPRVVFRPRRHGKSRWNSGFGSQVRLMGHLLREVPKFK